MNKEYFKYNAYYVAILDTVRIIKVIFSDLK